MKVTNIYAKMLRGAPFWMAVSLVLAMFVAPVQAADSSLETPVFDDGTEGAISGTEASTTSRGLTPYFGSGELTKEALIESEAGLVPSREEIKGLPPATGRIGTETVIGVDTRFRTYTTTYPARATALITFTGGYCTGWFYGPNVVATAGHCVHSGGSSGNWRTNVRVYPGYNAGSTPYGSYPAKWLASVVG